jgi:hypothetical protein
MRSAEDLARFYEQILEAARGVVRAKRQNEFTVHEVVFRLKSDFPEFTESAIRVGIVAMARLTTSGSGADFERVGHRTYRIVSKSNTAHSSVENMGAALC